MNQNLPQASVSPTPENTPEIPQDSIHETIKPPDSETLIAGLRRTYERSEEYRRSSMGQASNATHEFFGSSTAKRIAVIEENLSILENRAGTEVSDGEGEPIDRDALASQTAELIIAQACADMADAKLQLQRSASLLSKVRGLGQSEQANMESLQEARTILVDLDTSSVSLSIYLTAAIDDTEGYKQFSQAHTQSDRYSSFMRSVLDEYRTTTSASFDADQKIDQLETTFSAEARRVTDQTLFRELLDVLEERLAKEETKIANSAPQPETIEPATPIQEQSKRPNLTSETSLVSETLVSDLPPEDKDLGRLKQDLTA